jgi:predicted PurR-regulated permease PerM
MDALVRGAEHAGSRARQTWRHARALSRPIWIVAICSLVALLHAFRAALVPLALALLVACVLSGAVEALRRLRIPRPVSASVLLIMVALALGGMIQMTWAPAHEWLQSAPQVLRTIEHKARPAQSMMRRLDDIAQRVTALAYTDGEHSAARTAAPESAAAVLTPIEVFAATGWVIGGILTVMGFALLLLSAGPTTLARMTATLGGGWRTVQVLEIIDAIRLEVGRYYATLVLINIVYGGVIAGLMWLLGMPDPLLWGVIAGVLNFIPYLGAATTFTILSVVALVTFNTIGHVLLVAGGYLALAAVEGHVVEPIFLGRRLDLNPLVVLTALWLGGWLWGIAGVVLALPVLVAIKIAHRMAGAGRLDAESVPSA